MSWLDWSFFLFFLVRKLLGFSYFSPVNIQLERQSDRSSHLTSISTAFPTIVTLCLDHRELCLACYVWEEVFFSGMGMGRWAGWCSSIMADPSYSTLVSLIEQSFAQRREAVWERPVGNFIVWNSRSQDMWRAVDFLYFHWKYRKSTALPISFGRLFEMILHCVNCDNKMNNPHQQCPIYCDEK